MLESAPPGQLEEWIEFEKLEPFGWEQPSMVATQIINAVNSIALGMNQQEVDKSKLLPPDAFVPGREGKASRGAMSPAQGFEALRMRIGV